MECHTHTQPLWSCLIVDDSVRDQLMMTRAARYAHKDIGVQVAGSLREARRALMQKHFSIILLENALPDGRGVDFAIELAGHAKFGSIPIILVTDWPSPFMWHKAKKAGVRHVVDKSDFGPNLIRDVLHLGWQTQ